MKTSLVAVSLSLLVSQFLGHAGTIAQWNFNSVPPDGSTSTGTNVPSFGNGTATLVGDVSATFAAGSTNDPATSADDSGWNTSGYPPQDTANKTAGVQFSVSTLGYSNIVIRWDHKVSGTASKYCRLQYSTDGVSFTDFETPIAAQVVSTTSSYYEAQTNSLAAFPSVDNNPNFAFRIVSEFESTAIGVGGSYVTTAGANYSTAGTIRFDLVTVSGTQIPGVNTPPTISHLADQTIRVGHDTGALPFTIGDAEDGAQTLTLDKSSSNPAVIAASDISFTGTGANRMVTVTARSTVGTSAITLTVTDSGGRSANTSFAVTVLPLNTAPVISAILPTNTTLNVPTPPIKFTVYDLETLAGDLTLSASTSNTDLVLNQNYAFGGSGSNRSVTITPNPGQAGVTPVTLTVSDGTNSANSTFPLMILPSSNLVLYDPFSYPDGSVLTNSGFQWDNRSGTVGECQVTNKQLLVSGAQTEDVVAGFAGGSCVRSNGIVLYAGFKLKLLSLPKSTPGYFAHFVGGSSLRGRVYAGTTNALSGCFRLHVANGSDVTTEFPANLFVNSTYTIVTRYDIDSAATTLWVNPGTESDLSVTAADLQSPVTIGSYGFRQDASFGADALVDEFRVGFSFAAVLPSTNQLTPIMLNVKQIPGAIVLTWTDPAFGLQSALAPTGPFANVSGATSPYTNTVAGPAKFFRLKSN